MLKCLTVISGIFKAKYKGVYQFSVTISCGSMKHDLHFELRRATSVLLGLGSQVLANCKAKVKNDFFGGLPVTVTVFAELCPNDSVKVKI